MGGQSKETEHKKGEAHIMNPDFEKFYEQMKADNVAVAEAQKEVYRAFFEAGQKEPVKQSL